MDTRRYLCSQLAAVRSGGKVCVVNLEEIWITGAVLECECGLAGNAAVEIRWDAVMLAGRVRSVEAHEFGYRIEVELSALTPWSPEAGEPAHMVELSG